MPGGSYCFGVGVDEERSADVGFWGLKKLPEPVEERIDYYANFQYELNVACDHGGTRLPITCSE